MTTTKTTLDEMERLRTTNNAMLEALKTVRFALTNEANACWPTPRPWTKKERDETVLSVVRAAIAKAEQ